VHRNFESTEEMVNNLLGMAAQLDNLEQMLAADTREIVGPAPNLLIIHYQLNQLESFRNQTLHQAKKASPSSQATLTRWFERLNKYIVEFDEYFVQLAQNILSLVRAGHSDVVVKLIKIAEVEGKEDEKVCLFPSRFNGICSDVSFLKVSGNAICEKSCQVRCRSQIQVSSSRSSCA
jgi:hypothetical protein